MHARELFFLYWNNNLVKVSHELEDLKKYIEQDVFKKEGENPYRATSNIRESVPLH